MWHSWVGQLPALELLTGVGRDLLRTHAVGLANRFRTAVGLPDGDSAIVSLATRTDMSPRLDEAGIVASMRADRLRLSFHINNTDADADRAAEVLAGHVEL